MSPTPEFESLRPQDVRKFWEDEEADFTPWLAGEITEDGTSKLEDVLELGLYVRQREKRIGSYRVDIHAEVADDNCGVVIENQLTTSDHDHLGKALAYAAGLDADIIVWIAPMFNDEHRDAFQWPNEQSQEGVDLFALRLEVWRIGDSDPAVRFNPVIEPSEWQGAMQRENDLTDTEELRPAFWTAFRDRIREKSDTLRPRKPRTNHWYNNPVGRKGFALQFKISVQEDTVQAGFLIRDDAEAYEQLVAEREQIESEFGHELEWHEPSETRAGKQRSEIIRTQSIDPNDRDAWPEYIDWLVKQGEQLHDAFSDRVQSM